MKDFCLTKDFTKKMYKISQDLVEVFFKCDGLNYVPSERRICGSPNH